MKYAVIDIGSNSARLMFSDGVKTLSKEIIVTKLASGLIQTNMLSSEAVERTICAVSFFVNKARDNQSDKIYIFATAAVRSAKNGKDFTDKVKSLTGIEVDVISGECEAKINLMGALLGQDGGIIDIGGASSEIAVVCNGKKSYSHSLSWGACTITDFCGQELSVVDNHVSLILQEYGNIPYTQFKAVGGTATSIASILIGSSTYLPEKVNGFVVYKSDLYKLKNKLFSMSIAERKTIVGLMPDRAEIIASGVALMYGIMEKINLDYITISENDNLEGYLMLKSGEI